MKHKPHRDSLIALRIGFYGGLVVCVFDAVGQPPSLAAIALGSCLIAVGVILRIWAQVTLGPAWSIRVRIAPDHPLVTAGPYRLVRHPAYLALVLFYLGVAAAFQSVSGLMVFALGLAPALAHRMAVEEAALASHFGEDYLRYASGTKRLLPGVF